MNQLEEQLQDAQVQVYLVGLEAQKASEERKILIAEALEAGIRPSHIARLTGLSRERIRQITNTERKD